MGKYTMGFNKDSWRNPRTKNQNGIHHAGFKEGPIKQPSRTPMGRKLSIIIGSQWDTNRNPIGRGPIGCQPDKILTG
eukprot:8232347-Pyramimonas_sp.AAC.1